jgi:hypothetical protein
VIELSSRAVGGCWEFTVSDEGPGVPDYALHELWWLNFILNWTFWVEMIIAMWATLVWRDRWRGVV